MAGTASDQFFWNDWQGDPCLRICGLDAQGAWMRLLCIAAESTQKGFVLINGRKPTTEQLALVVGTSSPNMERIVDELLTNGVASRDRRGVLYSRRMVRDTLRREASKKGGQIGGRTTYEKQKGIFSTHDPTQGATQPPRRAPLSSSYPEETPEPPSPSETTGENSRSGSDFGVRSQNLRAPTNAEKGSRWPSDQTIPEPWRDEAIAKRAEHNLPPVDVDLEAEKFVNHYSTHAGPAANKTSWRPVWINWMLRAEKPRNGNGAAQRATNYENLATGTVLALEERARLRRQREGPS